MVHEILHCEEPFATRGAPRHDHSGTDGRHARLERRGSTRYDFGAIAEVVHIDHPDDYLRPGLLRLFRQDVTEQRTALGRSQ